MSQIPQLNSGPYKTQTDVHHNEKLSHCRACLLIISLHHHPERSDKRKAAASSHYRELRLSLKRFESANNWFSLCEIYIPHLLVLCLVDQCSTVIWLRPYFMLTKGHPSMLINSLTELMVMEGWASTWRQKCLTSEAQQQCDCECWMFYSFSYCKNRTMRAPLYFHWCSCRN